MQVVGAQQAQYAHHLVLAGTARRSCCSPNLASCHLPPASVRFVVTGAALSLVAQPAGPASDWC